MNTSPNILLVEDDADLGYVLKTYLEMHGFAVQWAQDGVQALHLFQHQAPDLCLLDVMLPKKDGFAVAQDIKQLADTPIIFLTAKGLKVDKLKGFQLGGDDYIVKPVDEEELIARIRAVLRRSSGSVSSESQTNQPVHVGQYLFEPANQVLTRGMHRQVLTEKEAALLLLLCKHKNRLLLRSEALKQIWGRSDYFNRRSMDVFIYRLRKYLEDDPDISITTVRGKGFILEISGAI